MLDSDAVSIVVSVESKNAAIVPFTAGRPCTDTLFRSPNDVTSALSVDLSSDHVAPAMIAVLALPVVDIRMIPLEP